MISHTHRYLQKLVNLQNKPSKPQANNIVNRRNTANSNRLPNSNKLYLRRYTSGIPDEEQIKQMLRKAAETAKSPKPANKAPLRPEMSESRLKAGPKSLEERPSVPIETNLPFLQTSVYTRPLDVLGSIFYSRGPKIAAFLTKLVLWRYCPEINDQFWKEFDKTAITAFAAVAEAMETRSPERLKGIFDPNLYSLLMDNYDDFSRLHDYRLSVQKPTGIRLYQNVTYKLPPFRKEFPVGISLWWGTNIIYSAPVVNRKLITDARKTMTQAIGTGYAHLRRKRSASESQASGLDIPIPERFKGSKQFKDRVNNLIKKPITGYLLNLLDYFTAIKNLGSNYLLTSGRIEIEVVYRFDAYHNVEILKTADKDAKPIKHENLRSPHCVTFRLLLPLDPDAPKVPKWVISEFDGMRETENNSLVKLIQLSTMTPEEISNIVPALRTFSRQYFTPIGPKPTYFEELKNLETMSREKLEQERKHKNDPTPIQNLSYFRSAVERKQADEVQEEYRQALKEEFQKNVAKPPKNASLTDSQNENEKKKL